MPGILITAYSLRQKQGLLTPRADLLRLVLVRPVPVYRFQGIRLKEKTTFAKTKLSFQVGNVTLTQNIRTITVLTFNRNDTFVSGRQSGTGIYAPSQGFCIERNEKSQRRLRERCTHYFPGMCISPPGTQTFPGKQPFSDFPKTFPYFLSF